MPGPGEFELIRRFFQRTDRIGRAPLGIGDDCALLVPAPGEVLAISTDMLVAGRHFFADVDPAALGHKALAVNLSDLAAIGARPLGFTLALALPSVDQRWLGAFAEGLFALADEHGCELIGGDTTGGPLNVCITVFGEVPPAEALRRDRARAGDDLWVSGALGAAAWAVACRLEDEASVRIDPAAASGSSACHPARPGAALAAARLRLERPQPRVALGLALRDAAAAAIDLSDGLVGDLGHVLERSSAATGKALGATIAWPAVPVDAALGALSEARRVELALGGGDDYELLFTAPAGRRDRIGAIAEALGLTLTHIGHIDERPGLRVIDAAGRPMSIHARSFDHFR
jgi:thiamine-monophosphate kinase